VADVLVVEDDEDVAFLMGIFLERDGHLVRFACDGEKGLACLSERLPEVVILDVEMPLLDAQGMAARMFVEDVGRERIPVVLVSGVTELHSVAEEIGTPYALPKPFDPAELIALVRRALRERRCPVPSAYRRSSDRRNGNLPRRPP
jgi:DNA-binding response OmpR family regulator